MHLHYNTIARKSHYNGECSEIQLLKGQGFGILVIFQMSKCNLQKNKSKNYTNLDFLL